MATSAPASGPAAVSRWWYAVAVGPVAFAFLAPAFALAYAFGTDSLPVLDLVIRPGFLLTLLGGFLFPIGVYFDTRAVAASPADWEPNPPLYALGSLLAVLVAVSTVLLVQVLAAAAYLLLRHRRIGVP